jgi:DNA-binding NarL/FixJ family response regulator
MLYHYVDDPEERPETPEKLMQKLLGALRVELDDMGTPKIVASIQIDDVRCTLVCAYIKNRYVKLSEREKQIARLLIDGLPNKTVAHELKIKSSTVAAYIKRIFYKLNVNSRAEMVAKIVQGNLLQ